MTMVVPLVVPPGYRFLPTDGELITYYLENKVKNESLEFTNIHDVDFYAHTPQELAMKYMGDDDEACYFFTKRSMKGKRSSRVACGGTWSGKTSGKKGEIPGSRKGQIIGHRKYFVYELPAGEKKMKKKPLWAMVEYTLSPPKSNEWALCKLHRTRATTTEEEEEDSDVKDDQEDSVSSGPVRDLDQHTRSKNKDRRGDDRVAAANVEDENKSKRQRTTADENEEFLLLEYIDNTDMSEFQNMMKETETLAMYQKGLTLENTSA